MIWLHQTESDWIAAIQGTSALRDAMLWFSYLGSEALPVALAFVYFVLSRRAGTRLYLLFAVSSSLMHVFKLAFHLPRPFWIDSRIKALSGSGGYGLPSGHVLSAGIVWPSVARAFGGWWAWGVAIFFILLVSISRVYLGVHFISDVVAAWIIAAGLHWGYCRTERKLSDWLNSLRPDWQMVAALWATAVLVTVGCGVSLACEGVTDPSSWSMHSAGARNLGGLFRSAGEFFGAACGIVLAGRWACFELNGVLWKRGGAFGYALLGTWLIRELARMMPSAQTEYLRHSGSFLQGTVSNMWILFLAPWILLRIGVLHVADPIQVGALRRDRANIS